jgi:hypothetical protein
MVTQIEEIVLTNKEYKNNYIKFINYLFDKENEIKELELTLTLTLTKPKTCLIYAPPQVGKTKSIIELVIESISRNIPVIISCDNKKDQMRQLYERLCKEIKNNYKTIFKNSFITTVDNKNFYLFKNKMKKYKNFIICCLDNRFQIEKFYKEIDKLSSIKDLCIIHDEADVITKSKDIDKVLEKQPESHKKWIELNKKLYNKGIKIKRVFVSATPENVIYLYKPEFVLELPIPNNYVSEINFNEIKEFDFDTIRNILIKEVKYRYDKKENGVILYCVERRLIKKENDNESNTGYLEDENESNQYTFFYNIIKNIKNIGLDVVSLYNSDGITLAFRLKLNMEYFIKKMKYNNKKYTICDLFYNKKITIKKTELSISEFYGYLQLSGCKVVLTIGKDLISRGISFVSNQINNPLTATTMIYKPGKQLSQVSIMQAIGRLNGTAEFNINRRLYTTEDVYKNYVTFIKNQKKIISYIRNNENRVDDNLITNISLIKSSRCIDRKVLNLEKNIKFEIEEENIKENDCNEIDGVKIYKLNKWINNNRTIVGKIITYLYYKDNVVTFDKLKNDIKYKYTDEQFNNNIDNGSGIKCQYGKLWNYNRTTRIITINPNIKKYLETLIIHNN